MTLSDLERQDTRNQSLFQVDLLINAGTVWHRTTNFGRITHVWERCIYRGSPTPLPQGDWAQVFPILEVPFQILRDNTYREGRGPSGPQFWVPFIYAYTLCHRSTKFDTWYLYRTRSARACILETATPPIPSEWSFSAPQF